MSARAAFVPCERCGTVPTVRVRGGYVTVCCEDFGCAMTDPNVGGRLIYHHRNVMDLAAHWNKDNGGKV